MFLGFRFLLCLILEERNVGTKDGDVVHKEATCLKTNSKASVGRPSNVDTNMTHWEAGDHDRPGQCNAPWQFVGT